MAQRREDKENRLRLDYPTFEDAVREIGRPQYRTPDFPDGVKIEPTNTDHFRVTSENGKTWDVEVVRDGVGYRWRVPEGEESQHAYASREFALAAAVKQILR